MLHVPGVDRVTDASARITVSVGYEDGKQKRKRKTFAIPKKIQGDEAKVHDWLIAQRAKFADQVQRGEIGNRTLTVEKWAEAWMSDYIKPYRKTATIDFHGGNLRLHILPELGKTKLENLTPMKITKFANTLPKKSNGRGGTLSATTVGDIRRTLSAMLETAVQQGIMPNNPAKVAQWPAEDRTPGKAATPEEMARFMAALDSEQLVWKVLFLLLATTGMRRGEAVGLDWDAVDLDRGMISIKQSATTGSNGVEINTPKTKAGIRNIAVVDSLVPMLKQLHVEQMKSRIYFGQNWTNSGAVFANPETGTRLNPDSVSTRFRKICIRCNVDMHLHELRHSYVTAALHAGVSLADIARQVGHASTEVTARVYAHAFGDEIDASKHISTLVQNALFEGK